MYHVLQVSCSTQFGREVQGAKRPGKSGVLGAARPPNEGDGRGVGYSQWILGGDTISGDGQGWVDVEGLSLAFGKADVEVAFGA